MTTSAQRDVALARLAATQHGLLSRAQIRSHGGDAGFIARRLRSGFYEPIADHVVALAASQPTWRRRVMAAVLSSGPGAAASHETAAVLHGLLSRRPELVDVSTPRPLRRDRPWQAHRSRDLIDRYVVDVDGIPCTSPPRIRIAPRAPYAFP